MFKYLIIIALPITFAMCHNNPSIKGYEGASIESDEVALSEVKVAPPPAKNPPLQTKVEDKKIIKDGRIGLKVENVSEAKQKVDTLLKQHNGYYANENLSNSDHSTEYYLKIRIPADNYESFIIQLITGTGEVLYKNLNAQDVTNQFIDIETRLENKRRYLNQYRTLLNKAKTIKDILEIEEKIRVLEEEIESSEGQLKYLSNQVAYSTLDLQLTKEKDYVYNPAKRAHFYERLKSSLSGGWQGFIDFMLFMVRVWPFWLIVVIGFYFYRRRKRSKK